MTEAMTNLDALLRQLEDADAGYTHPKCIREAISTIRNMRSAFSPRGWTQEQSEAWHRAIPDVQKAFEDLLAATIR